MKVISKWMGTVLLALPTLLITNAMAQEPNKPTLEDLIPGGETYRIIEDLYGLQWWGDTCIKPGIDSLLAVNPRNGKETLLVTREKINRILEREKLGKLSHLRQVSLPWANTSQVLINLPGSYVVYDWKADKITSKREVPKKGINRDYHTTSGNVAYTIQNNLFVNGIAVTNEPDGIVCGQSVHRNEFGISKGTYWSPAGNLLAFYRMDESSVTRYPLVDITTRVGKLNNVRYPMAGMTSHKVTVGIYNPETQKTIYLNAGDPTDRYFTNLSWAPDARSLYLIELNRDQNHARLCQYSAETGELMATLFEETHPKYVEPQHPIVFLPWDSNKFIYQSQRDGFNHLYLYDTNGKLIKQLTEGKWLVNDLLGFNTQRKEVVFNAIDALGSANFAVNVNSGKRSLPFSINTTTEGMHTGLLSASGAYIIDRYSSPTVPRNIDIIDTKTFKSINLLRAKNPFEGFTMPSIETGTIKAADGVTNL